MKKTDTQKPSHTARSEHYVAMKLVNESFLRSVLQRCCTITGTCGLASCGRDNVHLATLQLIIREKLYITRACVRVCGGAPGGSLSNSPLDKARGALSASLHCTQYFD